MFEFVILELADILVWDQNQDTAGQVGGENLLKIPRISFLLTQTQHSGRGFPADFTRYLSYQI